MDAAPVTPWRDHAQLRGRFHPQSPDDLQVVVHDGGPRATTRTPEAVWVRVSGAEGEVFRGTVLNVPRQLVTVVQGQQIQFIAPPGFPHGLMVTSKYLAERPRWKIHPCQKCNLAELFDAPSDLIRLVFSQVQPADQLEVFSAFCGACGGVVMVESRAHSEQAPVPPVRPWWKFW